MPAIECHCVSKTFGNTRALRNVDLAIAAGELFGIVGPHGAGKTTLCNLLAGAAHPTAGKVLIVGDGDCRKRGNVGYVTQRFSCYAELSVDENLQYAAGARGISSKELSTRRQQLLSMVGLDDCKNRLARKLSGGMKQKLALCCALISNPPILLLDEPTTGLDPLSRKEFWHLLVCLAKDGRTIVVATPQFDEAESCQRVALIYQGSIERVGSPHSLKSSLGLSLIEVRTKSVVNAQRLLTMASAHPLTDMQATSDRLEMLTSEQQLPANKIRQILQAVDDSVQVHVNSPSLENVFFARLKEKGFASPPARLFEHTVIRRDGLAIQAQSLNKHFGSFTAVKDASLCIKYGEVYGLLGANGAGKTTTMQMLAGLIRPTSGEATVAGTNVSIADAQYRQRIGYMTQKFTLYNDMTVQENLDFYASAYSLTGAVRRQRIDWAIQLSNLSGKQRELVGKLPLGQRQLMAFAAAVLHLPEVIFLDEPTAGLDPFARRQLWQLIRQLAASQAAILISTHFIADVEYCDRLGLMVEGTLVVEDSPTRLKGAASSSLEDAVVAIIHANRHKQA